MLNISDFHLFLFLYISQSSVATELRCGGNMITILLQNSLLNQRLKNFKNRLTFGKVINKKDIVGFLLTV